MTITVTNTENQTFKLCTKDSFSESDVRCNECQQVINDGADRLESFSNLACPECGTLWIEI